MAVKMLADPLLLTRRETANALNVSENTIRRLIARGELRPVKAIWRCRIARGEIDRFIRESSRNIEEVETDQR